MAARRWTDRDICNTASNRVAAFEAFTQGRIRLEEHYRTVHNSGDACVHGRRTPELSI
jgi:hypothetical protein